LRWASREKLKDTGYGGLPQRGRAVLNNFYWANSRRGLVCAASAAALNPYRAKHRVDRRTLKARSRHGAHLGEKPRIRREKPEGALRNRITEETC
jgi:acetyl-CoA C-acetyltransferase